MPTSDRMEYLAIALLIAFISATPLPWPPSWLTLSVIALEFDLRPAGVVVAGAVGAAAGRAGLAWTVRRFGPGILTPGPRENVEYLAQRLRGRRGRLGMAGLLAVSPPPSWVVNASAGLLAAPIFIVFAANLAGRTVTYGLGVGLTGLAAGDLTDRLHEALGPVPVAISLGVLALTVWLFLSIEWQTLLENRRLRLRGPLGPLRRPG